MKKVLTLSLITTSLMIGATIPNTDDLQKTINVPNEVKKIQDEKKEGVVEIQGKKEYAPIMVDDKSGKKIYVKDCEFEGNEHISSNELNELIKEFKDKELSFVELQNIASIITKEYRNKGYFVARAYVPKQNIQENKDVLKIAIIEGNYGEFKLNNNSRVKDSIVQGMLDDAKQRDNAINTNTLERSLLIINETPGVIVTQADVKPGEEVGTSDFIIKTESSNLYKGYVAADNYGSKYVGKNRMMAGIDVESPFKIGDELSLNGMISNGADLKNYKIAYNVPLMSNGLRGEISYANTDYNLVKLGSGIIDEEYYGDTKTIEAKVIYPIIKSKDEKLDFTATYSNKDISSTTDETDVKKINVIELGFSHEKNQKILSKDSVVRLEGMFTVGELDDENTMNGSYQKISVNTGIDMNFTPIYSMSTNLQMQKAFKNKNLDGTEDMSVGGINGVKVFPDAELSAENAIVLNTEVFAKLPEIMSYKHKVGLFYDVGTATMSDKTIDSTFESRTLQDIGIGYYSNYKNAFSKVQLARVVGGEKIQTEEEGDKTRLLLQVGWVF